MAGKNRGLDAVFVACAVATVLCSPNTHAQSSVTLYGTLDVGMLYTNRTVDAAGQNGPRQFSLVNAGFSPSRFGVAGHEDLGGGYYAAFKLESGIDLVNGGLDNTNGNFFGRQAWVGLGGSYGEVRMGLQYSPFEDAQFDLDPLSFDQFGSNILIYTDNSPSGIFVSNAVTYVSPKFHGLSGKVMLALGNVAGNFPAGRQYSASLKYEYGGLVLVGSIENTADSSDKAVSTAPLTSPLEAHTIGAAYNFSEVTVKASFSHYDAPEVFAGSVRSGGDNTVYNVGFAYHLRPIPMDVSASVFYIRDEHDSIDHTVMATLMAQYFMTKRTSLYGQIGLVNNRGNESFGLELDGDRNAGLGATTGAAVGIVHVF